MEKWLIVPLSLPAVIRNCGKCGRSSRFVCDESFRINANGKNIDVWLIYKCRECDTTWNMEILSRVKPHQIDKATYKAFCGNDAKTAAFYAFNRNILAKNKAIVCYEDIPYSVQKKGAGEEGTAVRELEIVSRFDFDLRLDRLLSDQLCISRSEVKRLIEEGRITASDTKLSAKTKIRGTLKIKIPTVL